MTTMDVANTFNAAITGSDADALRSVLAPDVTFDGPVAKASGVDDVLKGMAEMADITESNDVQVQLADDSNVLIWSTLKTRMGPATPTATWLKVSGGKITAIETVFSVGR